MKYYLLRTSRYLIATAIHLGFVWGCSASVKDSGGAQPSATATLPGTGTSNQVPSSTSPSQTSGSVSAGDDELVTAPARINGVYLAASRVAGEISTTSIKVGVSAMINDERLSKFDDQYKNAWELIFIQSIPVVVKLTKSTDAQYDQILEFFGTEDQYRLYERQVKVSLVFTQNKDGAIVNSVLQNTLFDLLP